MKNNMDFMLNRIRETEKHEEKILICDMNNHDGAALQTLFTGYGFKNAVFQPDITELKKNIKTFLPDFIISGNHLWENTAGVRFITDMKLHENTVLIIWSENLNSNKVTQEFRDINLHIIKKSGNSNELIDAVKKIKPVLKHKRSLLENV